MELAPKSAKNIDYSVLEQLLKEGKWKQSDTETLNIFLEITNRQKQGSLRVEDIDSFPCEDLKIVNQLWLNYSNNLFGFSVQSEIYLRLGGQREYDPKMWEKFCTAVGWRKGDNWVFYDELMWQKDISNTPKGHLPRKLGICFTYIAYRIVTCKIN